MHAHGAAGGGEPAVHLFVGPGPEDGQQVDDADGRRQVGRDALDVDEQLAGRRRVDDGDPHDRHGHHEHHKHPAANTGTNGSVQRQPP